MVLIIILLILPIVFNFLFHRHVKLERNSSILYMPGIAFLVMVLMQASMVADMFMRIYVLYCINIKKIDPYYGYKKKILDPFDEEEWDEQFKDTKIYKILK